MSNETQTEVFEFNYVSAGGGDRRSAVIEAEAVLFPDLISALKDFLKQVYAVELVDEYLK